MNTEQSQLRTRMFARALGPFFAIVPTIVAIRSAAMRTLFDEFGANPMWPWLFGAVLLLFGSLIIAFHQYWRSAAAVIVSLLGWFLALRGLALLTMPATFEEAGEAIYRSGTITVVRVLFGCLGLAGLYLTYVGYKPHPAEPKTDTQG